MATTVALGLIGVTAPAVPATAETPKLASQVHMHAVGPSPGYDYWVGDVHSRKRRCQRGRTVTVYYEGPKLEKIGSDRTDRYGHWQVPVEAVGFENPYYAEVSRKVVGRGGSKIVCKADRSPDFGFAPF